MAFENWIAFCAIALLATATPGPAALLVSVNSVSYGFRKSLFTVIGNMTGLFIMSGFSVIGLSALVLHSAVGFGVVKIAGAIYLIYLGLKMWRHGLVKLETRKTQGAKSNWSLYVQGVLIALTNPKAIVFTTALFPQFISLAEPLLPQFSLLVLSFMSLSLICLSAYGLLAHAARHKAQKIVSNKASGKMVGGTFIGAGCYLATTSN